MPDERLHVEAIGSTLLLTPRGRDGESGLDPRPGLLAAQLSAARHGCDRRLRQAEYARVLSILGWRQGFSEQHEIVLNNRSGWLLHEQLARGLGALCSSPRARWVASALARAARGAPGTALQVLTEHCWQGDQLDIQVALAETDGTLLTYALHYQTREAPSAQWLAQRFRRSMALCPLSTRASIARLSPEHYAPTLEVLRSKLGGRWPDAVASF